MPDKNRGQAGKTGPAKKRDPVQPVPTAVEEMTWMPSPAAALRRAMDAPPPAVREADVLTLQRATGNRAVVQLLSAARDDGAMQMQDENRTGMPDRLKAGIEALSGLSMSDVRVHYNSPRPAQLQSLAYAQGADIHVGPGQEKHLPHEAWHVVQQKQGRVVPTMQMGGMAINDDPGLEEEANVMGDRAANGAPGSTRTKAVDGAPGADKWTALRFEPAGQKSGSIAQRLVRVNSLTVKHTSTSETETSASHRFDIRAEFKEGSDDHWDFRQDIRGYWLLDGVEQTLKSSGSGLTISRESWVDDGYTKADDTNKSDPLVFETNDNPGGGFEKDKSETYYLQFRAKIIDTKDGNKVLKEKSGYWIKIHGKYPRKFTQGGFD